MSPKKHKKRDKIGKFLHIGKAKGKKDSGKKGKLAGGFKMFGKKLQAKMKTGGASLEAKMKKKKAEMRAKMKGKGNEMRKRMKEKMKVSGAELKKKMREKGQRMREKGHDLKAKMKDGKLKAQAQALMARGMVISADMKKRLKQTGGRMKDLNAEWERGLAKESTADVTSKLVTWRQTFEDKGWAIGRVYNDWATLILMGLNVFSFILGLVIFGVAISMASKLKKQCLTFLLTPAVVIGFLFSLSLLIISLAGFVGVWFNRLTIVKLQFMFTSVLIVMLFAFTVYGFILTYRGKGTKLPDGISFKKYNMSAYSKWLQRKINDTVHWSKTSKCIIDQGFCKWTTGTPEEVYNAKFTSTQLGCCAPPFECEFAYKAMTNWELPAHPERDIDCKTWNTTGSLCLGCNQCKAGVLQNVKSVWYRASVINLIIIVALGVVVYRTWFVMRVAGRWDSVALTVRNVVKPPKKEKAEEQSVIDIGEPVHEEEHHEEEHHGEEEHHESKDEDDDTLVPAWLEKDVPPDEIPKSSAGSEDSAGSEKKKGKQKAKGKKPAAKAPTEASEASSPAESELEPEPEAGAGAGAGAEADETTPTKSTKTKKKKKKKVKVAASEAAVEDDSWASPTQQADPTTGFFPQGFLAQNPLTAMSPWLQSPEAGYMQGGGMYGDPSYMQGGGMYGDPSYMQQGYFQGQTPADYMQGYYPDPYGQMNANLQGYDMNYMQQQDPSFQTYVQDPMQMMYPQDPMLQQQQMYMQQQDPSQLYMQQQYDPTQAYMQQQVPNQGYNQDYGYYQDPNQGYWPYG